MLSSTEAMAQLMPTTRSVRRWDVVYVTSCAGAPSEGGSAALSPVRGGSAQTCSLAERASRVIVPDFQASLAIGKEGQNARLAARLTGWRIDIRSDAAPVGDASDRPATSNG